MPRYKRYFPVSHDINKDPEIQELKSQFGLAGLCFWLECLAILDMRENCLKMNSYVLRNVSKTVSCHFSTGLKILNWIVLKGWIIPNKPFNNDLEILYESPNYLNYHRSRAQKKQVSGTQCGDQKTEYSGPPFPSLPLPSLPKKEKERERGVHTVVVKYFWTLA